MHPQPVPETPAQAKTRAVVENHRVLATRVRAKLANARDVHDRRAMNADERVRVEPLLHCRHRVAHEVTLPRHVYAHVVAVLADPIDICDVDEHHAITIADLEPSGTLRRWRRIHRLRATRCA